MPKIFVFTAGDRSARQHLTDSIENPIPDETVLANFAVEHHEELERVREEGGGFYAWGALPGPGNRRTWEAMDRGDRVLCVYDNTYRYSARVLAKYDNPGLARSVWGEGKDGKTWQYTYFLTEPKEIHRHVSELAGYLNASYFGFTKISDEKLEAIAAEYGSVEEFVDRAIEQTDRSNASALRAVLSWIRNLRTQASADGRFYYKPLILLALLDLLDADSGHPNSFGYEEMWAAFEGLATELGSSITEEQFSQPYVRIRNDVSPLQVWIPQVDGVAEIDDSKADRPAYVRTHAPSARIDDSVWECFLSPDGRAAIRQEISSIWAQKGQDKQALWFEPLEHPPGLEAELQLILERSNRKDQDLLAAIFRRAILLNKQHKTEGFLGAQRKILQRFSITIGNVYACAVARNTRETLYLLVDNDTTLRQAYEVGDARFSKSQLMWIHGGLDRDSLQSLLEDEVVWNAYERMLPKVTNFPLARSNHNNRGKLSVISGKRYEPEPDLRPNYWWVNQGATYRQERDGGYLWAPKESKGARVLSHHANLLRVRPGDVILHYAKGALRAASVVFEPAEETTRPSELPTEPWQAEGHLVRAEYQELSAPVPLEDIAFELRISKGGPFTQHGSVRQGYLFPLSLRFIKRLTEGSPERWPDFLAPPGEQKQVWLFQSNPKQWDLEQNLRTAHLGQEENWTVTRYRGDMRPGDTVILWQGGSNAGVYATGELISEPFERELPPWRPAKNNGPATEWAVSFCYTHILTEPIPKEVLLEHPVLSGMQVIRAPQGTNFKMTEEEWVERMVAVLSFDPPELRGHLARAIEVWKRHIDLPHEDDLSDDLVDVTLPGFDPSKHEDRTITPDTEFALSLPDWEDVVVISYGGFLALAEELEQACLVEGYACWTDRRYLLRIAPASDHTYLSLNHLLPEPESEEERENQLAYIELYRETRALEERLDRLLEAGIHHGDERFDEELFTAWNEAAGAKLQLLSKIDKPTKRYFLTPVSYEGSEATCSLTQGFTVFGPAVAASGSYDSDFPPVLGGEIFVEVLFRDGAALGRHRTLYSRRLPVRAQQQRRPGFRGGSSPKLGQ